MVATGRRGAGRQDSPSSSPSRTCDLCFPIPARTRERARGAVDSRNHGGPPPPHIIVDQQAAGRGPRPQAAVQPPAARVLHHVLATVGSAREAGPRAVEAADHRPGRGGGAAAAAAVGWAAVLQVLPSQLPHSGVDPVKHHAHIGVHVCSFRGGGGHGAQPAEHQQPQHSSSHGWRRQERRQHCTPGSRQYIALQPCTRPGACPALTGRLCGDAARVGAPAHDADLRVGCRAGARHQQRASRVASAEPREVVWIVGACKQEMGGA